jgi:hypothetical protein
MLTNQPLSQMIRLLGDGNIRPEWRRYWMFWTLVSWYTEQRKFSLITSLSFNHTLSEQQEGLGPSSWNLIQYWWYSVKTLVEKRSFAQKLPIPEEGGDVGEPMGIDLNAGLNQGTKNLIYGPSSTISSTKSTSAGANILCMDQLCWRYRLVRPQVPMYQILWIPLPWLRTKCTGDRYDFTKENLPGQM